MNANKTLNETALDASAREWFGAQYDNFSGSHLRKVRNRMRGAINAYLSALQKEGGVHEHAVEKTDEGKMGHTATPWATEYQRRPDGSFGQDIFDYTGERIATCAWYPVSLLDGATATNREANADFIVRAVNSHDDILAELDCRVGDLVMLRKAIEAGDPRAELFVRIDDMLRETRAAIAKASA